MDQTMYDQLPTETDRIPLTHSNAKRSIYAHSPANPFMSLPVADKLPFFVARFLHEVNNFERETFALRQSGSPKHLQKIKGFSQAIINRAIALTTHLEDTGLPDLKVWPRMRCATSLRLTIPSIFSRRSSNVNKAAFVSSHTLTSLSQIPARPSYRTPTNRFGSISSGRPFRT